MVVGGVVTQRAAVGSEIHCSSMTNQVVVLSVTAP